MELNVSNGSSFTSNGQFFALLSIDNRLRIWDTTSGKLIQEFSSAAIVESSCTCMCWTREAEGKKNKETKRKKRKTKTDQESDGFSCIVLGTKNGKLLLYNPVSGEAEGSFDGGHTNTVNCVTFLGSNDVLYSCSQDRYITEWSYEKREVTNKWKADKISVRMICLGPSGKTLLSAGMSIKLWNLDTKEEMMRFHGHTSPISLLQFSDFQRGSKSTEFDDGYYFLSGSTGDRIINAWHINLSNPEKSAIASYMLSDVPKFMKSTVVLEDDKPLKLCVGCQDGKIHFFTSMMNGKTNRPIECSKLVEIVQKEGKKSNTTPLCFLNGNVQYENDLILQLVSGSTVRPYFNKYVYSELETVSKIVKDITQNLLLNENVTDSDTTVELASNLANKRTHVIGNTYLLPQVPVTTSTSTALDVNGNKEDRQKTEPDNDVLMVERINGIKPAETDMSKLKPAAQGSSNAASFSQMVIQGLHTSDYPLLNEIFFKKCSEKVLRNTIQRIPTHLVGELLNLIVDGLTRTPSRSKDFTLWIKVILSVHLTHLLSIGNNSSILGRLFTLLKSHQEIYLQLFGLQGKIDLLFSHVANSEENDFVGEEVTKSTVVFHDESDDETEALFGDLKESDAEDNEAEEKSDSEDGEDLSSDEEEDDNDDEDIEEGNDENDDSGGDESDQF